MGDFGKENPDLTALVRWLLFLGVLLWIASIVASGAPQDGPFHDFEFKSQTGAAATTVTKTTNTTGTGGETIDTGETVSDFPPPGSARCGASTRIPPRRVYYACDQKGRVGEIGSFEQSCSPGFKYTIHEKSGEILIVPTALEPLDISGCHLLGTRPMCTNGQQAKATLSTSACEVVYCAWDGDKEICLPVGKANPNEALNIEESRMTGLSDIIVNSDHPEDILAGVGLSSGEIDAFDTAFQNRAEQVQGTIERNEATITTIQGEINRCTTNCDQLNVKITSLQQENANLQAELNRLALSSEALADQALNGPPDTTPQQGGNNGQNGTTPTGGTPTYTPQTTFQQNPPATTGGTVGQQQNTNTEEQKEGFVQFLQDFFGSVFGNGGEPAIGNQNPQDDGTCRPDLVCDGGTLFQRDSRCVDTPVQQCQFGCDRNRDDRCAATAADGQCTNAPSRPTSGCTNGTWEPEYGSSNNCITNWKCTNSAVAPTASLSCQPLVADAGMTLAITYSCSGGTSAGSGFSTNGALSGATTTTLMPPTGANTVKYGLSCTLQGLTSSADCTIQIGKPGIVLVANPNAVESGNTSLVGWVTSGMESCKISSPEQSDFTARNADKTAPNGVVATSPITSAINVVLSCTTFGGNTKEATTTISVL